MEKRKKGPGNILQCLVALFFISVTGSGAERSGAEMEKRKKGPGNILQWHLKYFEPKNILFIYKMKILYWNTHLCYISSIWNCSVLLLLVDLLKISNDFTFLKHAYSTRLRSSKHANMSASKIILQNWIIPKIFQKF